MDIISAYNMLTISGKEISKDKMIEIFNSIGANFNEKEIERFLSLIDGKSLNEMLEEGKKQMSCAVATTVVSEVKDVSSVKEEKKEEKKDEESEEVNLFEDF